MCDCETNGGKEPPHTSFCCMGQCCSLHNQRTMAQGVRMTDDPKPAVKSADSAQKPNGRPFAKGYDPRRWLGGRGKKSADQQEGEKILMAVIWEELSREFDTATMKPKETPEEIDALRLMVRSWIKKKPELIAERIAGKVTDRVDVNTDGTLTINIRKASDASGPADK